MIIRYIYCEVLILKVYNQSLIFVLLGAVLVTLFFVDVNEESMPTVPAFSYDSVGFAAHPLSSSFSVIESRATIVGSQLSVSDSVVYKGAFYSINGSSWIPFNLSGPLYNGNANWLRSYASRSMPNFGSGEHYILIYSCARSNNAWDCHGNKFQLIVINNTVFSGGSSGGSIGDSLGGSSGFSSDRVSFSGSLGIPEASLDIIANVVASGSPDAGSDCGDALDYQCGLRTICGQEIDYGYCRQGYECVNNLCMALDDATCIGVTCGSGEYCSHGVCLLNVTGNTYFVALWGNDSWPGTFEQPFYSWQKAVGVSRPGDITYIRGGVWQPLERPADSRIFGMSICGPESYNTAVSGTADAPIRYYNYPGEKPIVDGRYILPDEYRWSSGISLEAIEHIHLRGLTVRHIYQSPPDPTHEKVYSEVHGIASATSSNLRFENMVAHDIDGRGFQHWSGSWGELDGGGAPFEYDNTSWINCDSYNIFDRYSQEPGNAGDAWKVHAYYGNNLYWEGCRAFYYSDDGFDPSGEAYRYFKNSWAMASDKYKDIGSWNIEGNGFKATGVGAPYVPDYESRQENFVRFENCLAIDCNGPGGGIGFYNNILVNYDDQLPNRGVLYNNFAYQNGIGYNEANGSTHRNNIVYDSQQIEATGETYEVYMYHALIDESHNTWMGQPRADDWWWEYNPDYDVTDDDFVSLDKLQLMRPRNTDFSLPHITFGHLSEGSELIDGGVVVPGYHCPNAGAHPGENCREWYGNAPDLGPFESNYESSYDSVSVDNSVSVDTPLSCSGSSTRSCNITNGTGVQSMNCNTTTGTWGTPYSTCNVTSCNANYFINGSVCSYALCSGSNNRSCDVLNGIGIQYRVCTNGSWSQYGVCSLVDCNPGYHQEGSSCVIDVINPTPTPTQITGAIIADHNAADDFDIIPQCWIERAKDQFVIGYGHTSHGSQIVSGILGLNVLMNAVDGLPDNLYSINNGGSGGALDFEEGAGYGAGWLGYDVGYGGWDDETRYYLDGYDPGAGSADHSDVNVIMWSWCGQVNDVNLQTHYFDNMDDLESEYPHVTFIYMTGHREANQADLYANNQIRDYVESNGRVLFDFADIESYDPLEVFYPLGTDACEWCSTWCTSNSVECSRVTSAVGSCSHSHDYNCYRKAKAFWWMMARMAGWDGSATHTCS